MHFICFGQVGTPPTGILEKISFDQKNWEISQKFGKITENLTILPKFERYFHQLTIDSEYCVDAAQHLIFRRFIGRFY